MIVNFDCSCVFVTVSCRVSHGCHMWVREGEAEWCGPHQGQEELSRGWTWLLWVESGLVGP
jgi:hypothetical protein